MEDRKAIASCRRCHAHATAYKLEVVFNDAYGPRLSHQKVFHSNGVAA
jgi:hypothetical protein